jgi:hypothetical protein
MIIHMKKYCHIIVHGLTHDNSCEKNLCHINVPVESHCEPCDV